MPRRTGPASIPERVLDRFALNRALLARQHLVERTDSTVPAMLEHLVGMQAQLPEDPYVGLWSRIRAFDPGALSSLIADRSAVRIAIMRSTIHLVTASDALLLRPLTQGVIEGSFRGNQMRLLGGVDQVELDALALRLVDERPRTTIELGRLLAERWPESDPVILTLAARVGVPLVQVPPRGLWGGRGQVTVTSLEAWLGRAADTAPSIDDVAVRYLRAFGPASSSDIRTWSGITGLREVLERLRPELRVFHDERGRELLDVPDGLLPDPATPAPIRFLPVYDNLVLSHADRSRVIAPDVGSVLTIGQENVGSVLIDGFVGALWRLRRERRSVRLSLNLLRAVTPTIRREVEDEAEAVLDFLARDAATRELVVRTIDD